MFNPQPLGPVKHVTCSFGLAQIEILVSVPQPGVPVDPVVFFPAHAILVCVFNIQMTLTIKLVVAMVIADSFFVLALLNLLASIVLR